MAKMRGVQKHIRYFLSSSLFHSILLFQMVTDAWNRRSRTPLFNIKKRNYKKCLFCSWMALNRYYNKSNTIWLLTKLWCLMCPANSGKSNGQGKPTSRMRCENCDCVILFQRLVNMFNYMLSMPSVQATRWSWPSGRQVPSSFLSLLGHIIVSTMWPIYLYIMMNVY